MLVSIYAEGYAYAPIVEVVLPHVWCVDDDGVVADPAWFDAHEASYRGVALDLSVVRAWFPGPGGNRPTSSAASPP